MSALSSRRGEVARYRPGCGNVRQLTDTLRRGYVPSSHAPAASVSVYFGLFTGVLSVPGEFSFDDAQAFLKKYCQSCHPGKSGVGGFGLQRVATQESLRTEGEKWSSLRVRVINGEMPPRNSPAPPVDLREQFSDWVKKSLRAEACAAGITPGRTLIRRLNRDEYAATVRDLLDMHMDIGRRCRRTGRAERASTMQRKHYSCRRCIRRSTWKWQSSPSTLRPKNSSRGNKILIAKPGPGVSPDQAARKILQNFLPARVPAPRR